MGKPRYSYQDRLLTSYEVAEYLQLGHRLVRRLMQAGKIRAIRLEIMGEAKEWRVPFSSVAAYLADCESQTEANRKG